MDFVDKGWLSGLDIIAAQGERSYADIGRDGNTYCFVVLMSRFAVLLLTKTGIAIAAFLGLNDCQ